MIKLENEKCVCCGQNLFYVLAIDRGTVQILKKLALFIKQKGINIVHPRKEMEGAGMSSNEVGNLSRPRMHGFIAKVKGNPGNYCLTRKGADFLRGYSVPRYAIRSKVKHETVGYVEGENCTIHQVDGEYWQGINYTISDGHVIFDV